MRAPTVTAPAPLPMPHEEHLPGVTFDLDVHDFEHEERVRHYVRLFTGSARGTFTEWMARGARYDGMIRAKLRAGGLPEDLRFLPLVESGYDVHAVSRASAVGMWQFMAPTARDVGLRVDWWVDERRDPVRATDAAVRMLRWLKSEFGSFFVAAAAYNGGPGRVSRGLAQLAAASDSALGDARFFSLVDHDYIRPETKNYVPQLIAATLIGNEPSRYGMSVREARALAYDSVEVPALTPLAAVARAAGASRSELLDLNPQFLRGLTPPERRGWVRLPVGGGVGFAQSFARLDARERRAFRRTTTRRRDALSAIAAREDVPMSLIAALNPRLETVRSGKYKGRIVSGQGVRLPTAAVLAYARSSIADAAAGDEPGPLPALAAEPVSKSAADEGRAGRTRGSKPDTTQSTASADDAATRAVKTIAKSGEKPVAKAASKAASKARSTEADTVGRTDTKRTSVPEKTTARTAPSDEPHARAADVRQSKPADAQAGSSAASSERVATAREERRARTKSGEAPATTSKPLDATADGTKRTSDAESPATRSRSTEARDTQSRSAQSRSTQSRDTKSGATPAAAEKDVATGGKSKTGVARAVAPASKARRDTVPDVDRTPRDRGGRARPAKPDADAPARERAADAPAARKRSAARAESRAGA